MWALNFHVDVSSDGRQIRCCNVVDEFTREALATAAARSFTADDTTILLEKIIAETGRRPENLRMDNGPELTAIAMWDGCRFGEVRTAWRGGDGGGHTTTPTPPRASAVDGAVLTGS